MFVLVNLIHVLSVIATLYLYPITFAHPTPRSLIQEGVTSL